jgi:hypothetical protein
MRTKGNRKGEATEKKMPNKKSIMCLTIHIFIYIQHKKEYLHKKSKEMRTYIPKNTEIQK